MPPKKKSKRVRPIGADAAESAGTAGFFLPRLLLHVVVQPACPLPSCDQSLIAWFTIRCRTATGTAAPVSGRFSFGHISYVRMIHLFVSFCLSMLIHTIALRSYSTTTEIIRTGFNDCQSSSRIGGLVSEQWILFAKRIETRYRQEVHSSHKLMFLFMCAFPLLSCP